MACTSCHGRCPPKGKGRLTGTLWKTDKKRALTFLKYSSIIKRKGGDEMKPNMDLRLYARGHGVPLWRIAQEYGFSEQTIIMRLRKQYSKEDAEEFMRIVDKISREE